MTKLDFPAMRAAMISGQLRTNNVSDPRLVAAIGAVPREQFVPAEKAALAYADLPVALGEGRVLNTPLATARLIVEANVSAGDKVLVIGTATGYAAAILAGLGAEVTEVQSDLTEGDGANAPYDAIVVDGAIAFVPDAFREQLVEGGRLATGLLDDGVSRLAVARKAGESLVPVPFADVHAVPLPGFEKPRVFAF